MLSIIQHQLQNVPCDELTFGINEYQITKHGWCNAIAWTANVWFKFTTITKTRQKFSWDFETKKIDEFNYMFSLRISGDNHSIDEIQLPWSRTKNPTTCVGMQHKCSKGRIALFSWWKIKIKILSLQVNGFTPVLTSFASL